MPGRPALRAASLLILPAVMAAACASSPRTGPAPPSGPARYGIAVEQVAQTPNPTPAPSGGAAAWSPIARAEEALSLRLLQHLAASGAATTNVTLSPLSLALVLAMLENGTAGTTRAQIASVMGTPSLANGALDEGWAALMTVIEREAGASGVQLRSADSLWLQQGLQVNNPFLVDLTRYFGTGVWKVDFAHQLAAAADAIDQWVAGNTAGKITHLFAPGDISNQTALVVANAVYFKAAWQTKFDPARSTTGQFHPTAASSASVTYMHGSVPYVQARPGYDAAVIPYSGGKLEAVVVMPTTQSLSGFVAALTPDQLGSLIPTATTGGHGDVALPKFTTSYYINLNHALQSMGITAAYSDAADFHLISPTPLTLQSVVQRDYVSVDENGTTAAAASGGAAMATAAPVEIRFDRPFLFLVRDSTTGTILFASLVENPSAG